MRFGVIGLGSMGKRRVRDLRTLDHEVVGFDTRADRASDATALFGIPTVESFEALIAARVDACIISTPPDQHVVYYKRCFDASLPFFSEASILTPRTGWFAERELASGVRGYPSATWTYYPLLLTLRDAVREIGLDRVQSLHHHYAGWLPSWHPWEAITDFYAGRFLTSAAREMVPFEMEWLCWLLGPVRAVCAIHDQRSEWNVVLDDHYDLLIEFEQGARATLSIQLHDVAPSRVARLSCRGHSFMLDFGHHELEWYTQASESSRLLRPTGLRASESFDFEDVYLAEIRSFADSVATGAPSTKGWQDDRHLSNILFAAEESDRRRAWVNIAEAETLYDGLNL